MSHALVESERFQIAIVGGGIAGLTLALLCERLNISFVLLEARESITAEQGASVGLLLEGLRILDQLESTRRLKSKPRHYRGGVTSTHWDLSRQARQDPSRKRRVEKLFLTSLVMVHFSWSGQKYCKNKDNRRSLTRATSIPLDYGNDRVVI
ncbi:hypothetical protein E4T50_09102 [Aureobasidium sp. EXF-12298]|nr:hypothetical protein E4T50_09102 [Aureobasidium sp. EXF-12298]KAI4758063.1 hypothetical protein E4T51_08886 [Aureobasidium sp. EXF-12344]